MTGDTGPMHMSVAVGTPVVSMFLASAFGFETGPYSEGNIVIQPVIACGPCNPNKSCGRPDCHDTIDPEWLAQLTMMRIRGDVRELPAGFVDSSKVVVYRSYFDSHGFCNFEPLSPVSDRTLEHFRNAYRNLWLDDLGGYVIDLPQKPKSGLSVMDQAITGLDSVREAAQLGVDLVDQLIRVIKDSSIPASQLGEINSKMLQIDRKIEEIGFQHPPLGPLTRMFVFGKENLSGTEPLVLASQMKSVYQDLNRRCGKFAQYYNALM